MPILFGKLVFSQSALLVLGDATAAAGNKLFKINCFRWIVGQCQRLYVGHKVSNGKDWAERTGQSLEIVLKGTLRYFRWHLKFYGRKTEMECHNVEGINY